MVYKAGLKIVHFQGLNWVAGMSGNGCIVGDRLPARYLMVLELQGHMLHLVWLSNANTFTNVHDRFVYLCSGVLVCVCDR